MALLTFLLGLALLLAGLTWAWQVFASAGMSSNQGFLPRIILRLIVAAVGLGLVIGSFALAFAELAHR